MFETMPADDWADFVPPVPPDDEDVDAVDPEVCDAGPDPDLTETAGLALSELDDRLERARRDGLDADATLAEADSARRSAQRAEASLVEMAAHWADLHAVLTRPWMRTPGRERLVQLGGDGTPLVAEFAPAEFGAVIGISDGAATSLVADALDLRHRFPLLWQRAQTGRVDVWVARKIVQQTRKLSTHAAARVDADVAHLAGTLTWRRLRHVVDKAILEADPPAALSDAERAAAEAGVFVDPEVRHGYAAMMIKARAGDIQALEDAIDLLSRSMKILGDSRPPQQRRADAAGIIANPRAAQDLIARAEQVRTSQRDDGRSGSQRPFALTKAVLYYHLSKEAVDAILAGRPFAGAAPARVDDIGPLILDQVRQWLQHSNVVLKPVIDLPGIQPVDHYETPPAISEAIRLIRHADSFPHGSSLSAHQDNEHTVPFVPFDQGGPPGQTDPRKMSRMTRLHHRIKTHGGWTVRQLRTGSWLYRSPHHYFFIVDHHGTTPLGRLC